MTRPLRRGLAVGVNPPPATWSHRCTTLPPSAVGLRYLLGPSPISAAVGAFSLRHGSSPRGGGGGGRAARVEEETGVASAGRMRDRLAAARSEEEEAGAPSAGLAARERQLGDGEQSR